MIIIVHRKRYRHSDSNIVFCVVLCQLLFVFWVPFPLTFDLYTLCITATDYLLDIFKVYTVSYIYQKRLSTLYCFNGLIEDLYQVKTNQMEFHFLRRVYDSDNFY